MSDLRISIEGISPSIRSAYEEAALGRALHGEAAIDWAFLGNKTPFSVARQEGEVVGFSAYIRSEMKLGEQVGAGYQAVDSFVSERARGRGIFTALARAYDQHVKQANGDLIWGFPNDNAASVWFNKLDWQKQGQVPFLIKPLRAGYFLRRFRLPGDFSIDRSQDQNLAEIDQFGDWADAIWERVSRQVACATIRDKAYLTHRLLKAPNRSEYRIVADSNSAVGAFAVTREAEKHGGRIAYLMEALGGETLRDLLNSEMGRLRTRGVELVLAWAYPWSPNYQTLRDCGFFPLPQKFRPINIWFGTRAHSSSGICANDKQNWHLSYLDSDTV